MSEFGDLANLDLEKLIRVSEEQSARVQEMQERATELTGVAETKDGRIKVTCTVNGGITDIRIDPRAMRMPAADFAETLKTLIRDANADLHRQLSELMAETYGEGANPMALAQNQEAVQRKIQDAAAAYDRTLDDAMSELQRITKQLGL
jgi:DNA-binding protein YbaB